MWDQTELDVDWVVGFYTIFMSRWVKKCL